MIVINERYTVLTWRPHCLHAAGFHKHAWKKVKRAARPRHKDRRTLGRCAQRYISTRAMFIDVRELAPGSPAGAAADAASAQAALRGLVSLFKGLLAACREDALVMEQAWPRP